MSETDIDSGFPVEIANGVIIDKGTVLSGDYRVDRTMNVTSGEAELFICEKDGTEYVAKVYRRRSAIKPEVAKVIADIDSPYVARLYTLDTYEGYPMEILPYYKNGSLQGKCFSIQELRENIIPSLNEGLKVLHDHGVYHKDLKPSNIMLCDDGKTVAIIDFGISSIQEDGSTHVVTQTGLTPEYAAPEAFRDIYLAESDYFSLGITLHELACGSTPYHSMPQEEIEKALSLHRTPVAEELDASLKDLILGLTFNDISNRHDKTNPNHRWTYEEVKKWCAGIRQELPGNLSDDFRPFVFKGKSFGTLNSLVTALALDWDEGKRALFRGLVGGHFSAIDPKVTEICLQAQDDLDSETDSEDRIFLKTLYKIAPDCKRLFWEDVNYSDLNEFGEQYLNCLEQESVTMNDVLEKLATNGVFSLYLENRDPENQERIRCVREIEKDFNEARKDKRRMCSLAYLLVDKKILPLEGHTFETPDEFAGFMYELEKSNPRAFERFCSKIIWRNELDYRFEAWMTAHGHQSAIEHWRESLSF